MKKMLMVIIGIFIFSMFVFGSGKQPASPPKPQSKPAFTQGVEQPAPEFFQRRRVETSASLMRGNSLCRKGVFDPREYGIDQAANDFDPSNHKWDPRYCKYCGEELYNAHITLEQYNIHRTVQRQLK